MARRQSEGNPFAKVVSPRKTRLQLSLSLQATTQSPSRNGTARDRAPESASLSSQPERTGSSSDEEEDEKEDIIAMNRGGLDDYTPVARPHQPKPPQHTPRVTKREADTTAETPTKKLIHDLDTQALRRSSPRINRLSQSNESIQSRGTQQVTTKSGAARSSSQQLSQTSEDGSCIMLPVDFALKRNCVFTSEESFSWCATPKSADLAHGLLAFSQRLNTTSTSTISSTQKQQHKHNRNVEDFTSALMYYQHPAYDLPEAMLKSISSIGIVTDSVSRTPDQEAEHLLFQTIQKEWSSSLQSLYSLLRNQLCPHFYVKIHPFLVLFSISDSGETSAIITKSTKTLRALLSKEEVPFEMPLNNETTAAATTTTTATAAINDEDDEDEQARRELRELSKKFAGRIKTKLSGNATVIIDGKPQSLLLFSSSSSCHALFDFLLNQKYSSTATRHLIPTLYSPVPFLNASLKSISIKANNKVPRKVRSQHEVQYDYVLELSGPIFPWNIARLCCVFERTQKRFHARFQQEESAVAVNNIITTQSSLSHALNNAYEPRLCEYFAQQSSLLSSSLSLFSFNGTHYVLPAT